MSKEQIKSLLRSGLQVLGVLIALPFNIPYVEQLLELFGYVNQQLDFVYAAIETLIGVALYLYGFLRDGSRWSDREVGAEVKQLAEAKKMSISAALDKFYVLVD